MQRIAIIIPFPNNAVEYEFHKIVNNKNIIYSIYRIEYQTHQSEDEKKFYLEMQSNLDTLIDKLVDLGYDKVILMCSSLSSRINNKNVISVNSLVCNYIHNRKLNKDLLFVSPYSEETTKNIIKFFQEKGIEFDNFYINSQRGSSNYFNFGINLDKYLNKEILKTKNIFVSCTNVPVVDLDGLNILSSNLIVAEYLNKL